MSPSSPRVAVMIPCFNEAVTVAKVVSDFRLALPEATIYVFDNNSTDDTAREAADAGATVVPSPEQGKGNVVRHMFRHIQADHFLLVDGDDTYPADQAPRLLAAMAEGDYDMVIGARMEQASKGAFPRFHHFGNKLLLQLVRLLFRIDVRDLLSGYRVFSRRFIDRMPLTATGFEIETQLTLLSALRGMKVREVRVPYRARPAGSESKLNTFSDGFRVLGTILKIYASTRFGRPRAQSDQGEAR